jgi:hypothetical protein
MRRESVARRRPPSRNCDWHGNEVGVGKESCERPKPSSSSDVSFERRREAPSKRAVEENQSSVTTESVLGQSGGHQRNDVIILSSSTSSPSSIVKFHVTANELKSLSLVPSLSQKKKNRWREVGRESGCSRRVLNVGKA